jgi:hypothetical protein
MLYVGFLQVHRAAADSKVSVFGHAFVALKASRFPSIGVDRTMPKLDAFRILAID